MSKTDVSCASPTTPISNAQGSTSFGSRQQLPSQGRASHHRDLQHIYMGAENHIASQSPLINSWSPPFLYPDPMSVDIDTASSLLSGPDDTLLSWVDSTSTYGGASGQVDGVHSTALTPESAHEDLSSEPPYLRPAEKSSRDRSLGYTAAEVSPLAAKDGEASARSARPLLGPCRLDAGRSTGCGNGQQIKFSALLSQQPSERRLLDQRRGAPTSIADSSVSRPHGSATSLLSREFLTDSRKQEQQSLPQSFEFAGSYVQLDLGDDSSCSRSCLTEGASVASSMLSDKDVDAGWLDRASDGDGSSLAHDFVSDHTLPGAIERVGCVTRAWNESSWAQARLHLRHLLDQFLDGIDRNTTRKVLHLQGVAASLMGDWEAAVDHFIHVLNVPIRDASALDTGDCAAACWLGDTCALLGRVDEALLAYSIAEHATMSQGQKSRALRSRLRMEQAACQHGIDQASLMSQLKAMALREDSMVARSLFDSAIITQEAARKLLGSIEWPAVDTNAAQNQNRGVALWSLGLELDSWQDRHNLRLSETIFEKSSPWPMHVDPFFTISSIPFETVRPCDLLEMITSQAAQKGIPKAGAMSRKGMTSFTCQDIHWLISTIRACLRRLNIEWCETCTAHSTGFRASYDAEESHIATRHYFSIALFRLTFRPGYGAEVCPDGISSARVSKNEPSFDKGVHQDEVKRIRKMVRAYLDAALDRKEEMEMRGVVAPLMSVNGAGPIGLRRMSTRTERSQLASGAASISSKSPSFAS